MFPNPVSLAYTMIKFILKLYPSHHIRSKCTQTPVSKCYDPLLRHALRPGNVLSALTSYLEEWRRDSDERVRQVDDFSEARGLALSTTAGDYVMLLI